MNLEIKNLIKYPEFYALKQELEKFCDEMADISDIDLETQSRVSLNEEIAGRLWAAKKVTNLLFSLGLVERDTKKRDQTFE